MERTAALGYSSSITPMSFFLLGSMTAEQYLLGLFVFSSPVNLPKGQDATTTTFTSTVTLIKGAIPVTLGTAKVDRSCTQRILNAGHYALRQRLYYTASLTVASSSRARQEIPGEPTMRILVVIGEV